MDISRLASILVLASLSGAGACDSSTSPEPLPPGDFTTITAGAVHSCALDVHGVAHCWGSNSVGQLGTGDFVSRQEPTPVAGNPRFRSIRAGGTHTCGVTEQGAVHCWGSNVMGELGTGTVETGTTCQTFFGPVPCSLTPVQVTGGRAWQSLSLGNNATCGVTTGGDGFCWGGGVAGRLGASTAEQCTGTFGVVPCSSQPLRVQNLPRVTRIAAAGAHSCAVATNGVAYCWGAGSAGRLGTGSSADSSVPAPVAGGQTWRSLTLGYFSCGVTTGGEAYCWGLNQVGQLGADGDLDTCRLFSADFDCALTPVPVSSGGSFAGVSISLSDDIEFVHTCGLDDAGNAYCWGANPFGQVGAPVDETCVLPHSGSQVQCATRPVPVGPDLTFIEVDAGARHSCGVTDQGHAYCWGGAFGQVPVRIALPEHE